MGRHRRTDAGRATTGRATGVTLAEHSPSGSAGPWDGFAGETVGRAPEPWDDPAPYADARARRDFSGHSYAAPYASEPEPWDPYVSGPAPRSPYPSEPEPWDLTPYAGDRMGRNISPYAGDRAPRNLAPSAGRQAAPRGIAPYLNPETYTPASGLRPLDDADATTQAHAHLFADPDGGPGGPGGDDVAPASAHSPGHRRRKKSARPVRTGLLGVSAAVALGTAAVATGVVPGLQNYKLGGGTQTTGGDRVQAANAPGNTAAEQGGSSGSADSPGGAAGAGPASTAPGSPSRSASSSASASPSPSASTSASPTPAPSKTASRKPATATPAGKTRTTPSRKASKSPAAGAPGTASAASAAEAQVLKLVNEERAKVGCSPLTASSSLSRLAESFSDDMAARGFFDHTDPDGKSPWDRAAAAGIANLGGENIARGQSDAAAVMQAWMNSPGHRANILNCDFKTLGVGVHFGPGGPWWTQDFGY
ncbi:CAP domain-containing protein [Streptomyces sp. NBC_00557]|nr:CAP domain-containing protein [Streptomyces sp. NBC_00557]WUC39830.1 CAP domain-containing protein [Streptomyces sp. NBC_00557]